MIKTVIIDNNTKSLDLVSSIIKNNTETEYLGGFSDFCKLQNIDINAIDLVVFDVQVENLKEIIENIKKLKSKKRNLKFIAMSSIINSSLVEELKQYEIEELILKPVLGVVLDASIKKLTKKDENKRAKTITFFSLKNGTGKTSTLVNVAYCLSQNTDEKVCILDLNTKSSDVSDYLGVKNKQSFEYILNNIENFDKKTLKENIACLKDTNLFVLSLFEEVKITNFSKKDIIKILNSLKKVFDYIFVDIDANIDEKTLSILNNIDLIVLVGLFNLQQVKNLQQCYELFEKIGYNENRTKLLINRTIPDSIDTKEKIEIILNKKIDYTVQNNYITLIDSINRNLLVEEANPQSNIAKAYKKISEEIAKIDFDEIFKTNKKEEVGMFDLLKRMGE